MTSAQTKLAVVTILVAAMIGAGISAARTRDERNATPKTPTLDAIAARGMKDHARLPDVADDEPEIKSRQLIGPDQQPLSPISFVQEGDSASPSEKELLNQAVNGNAAAIAKIRGSCEMEMVFECERFEWRRQSHSNWRVLVATRIRSCKGGISS